MALALLLLDCDGVILESVDSKGEAFRRIGLEYGQEAGDRLFLYHAMHGGVSRYEKFAWFYKEVLGKEPSSEELLALGKKFADYCLDEVSTCRLVPGIQEVLDYWKGKLPIYVASGAPHTELNLILEQRGLAHYFTGIYGSPPGKTQLLRNILAETGIHPSQAVMVGDSSTDQIAAETVHSHFYGRGKYFKHSGHPWHEDLTQLNAYLQELSDTP